VPLAIHHFPLAVTFAFFADGYGSEPNCSLLSGLLRRCKLQGPLVGKGLSRAFLPLHRFLCVTASTSWWILPCKRSG
jgi:hypothetical protein